MKLEMVVDAIDQAAPMPGTNQTLGYIQVLFSPFDRAPTLRTASLPASVRCPSPGRMGGLSTGSLVNLGRLVYRHRLCDVSSLQSSVPLAST